MKNDNAIRASFDVMEAHISALNAHDESRIAATLHFPHIRLSDADQKIWETSDSYFADFRSRAGDNWKRSSFDDIRVVWASDNKVHLDAQVNRYDSNDEIIATFRSLWIITCEHGHWAAKLRSSFAPE